MGLGPLKNRHSKNILPGTRRFSILIDRQGQKTSDSYYSGYSKSLSKTTSWIFFIKVSMDDFDLVEGFSKFFWVQLLAPEVEMTNIPKIVHTYVYSRC